MFYALTMSAGEEDIRDKVKDHQQDYAQNKGVAAQLDLYGRKRLVLHFIQFFLKTDIIGLVAHICLLSVKNHNKVRLLALVVALT